MNIKKIRPLFTGVVTTARRYVGEIKTGGGLILDTTRMEGDLNYYQTVIAVGDMCKDIKEGDVVTLNFKRYAKAKHVPGAIDDATNTQMDKYSMTYEIPMVMINGQECLFMQNNDIEYIVEEYETDEGGLLQ